MPPYLRAVVGQLWDALVALVNGFLAEFSISEDDPHVKAFRGYFAVNISPDFYDLPLSDLIVYCLFTSSVSHHLWGHIFPGMSDLRYVAVLWRRNCRGRSSPHGHRRAGGVVRHAGGRRPVHSPRSRQPLRSFGGGDR